MNDNNEFSEQDILATQEQEHIHAHINTHEDSDEHEHCHEHEHEHTHHVHGHHHDPKQKKRQINRLSRIIGHLEYVKRMIEEDQDCADVLIQIASSKSALNGLGKQIISEHITHCIAHAIEDGDTKAIEDFQASIDKFI